MDVSDSEEEPQRKKTRNQLDGNQEDVERLQSLKEENDSLRCQLEAYKNEVCIKATWFDDRQEDFSKTIFNSQFSQVDLLKSETKAELEAKEKQMKMLQQTLKGMQEQLMQSRKQQAQDDQKIKDLTVKLNATKKEEPRESEIITLDKDDDISEEPRTPKQHILTSNFVQVTQKDAKLIGNFRIFRINSELIQNMTLKQFHNVNLLIYNILQDL